MENAVEKIKVLEVIQWLAFPYIERFTLADFDPKRIHLKSTRLGRFFKRHGILPRDYFSIVEVNETDSCRWGYVWYRPTGHGNTLRKWKQNIDSSG